ncbi:MAG: type II secretion system F family protein [Blastocatellia bacterium]
MPIIIPISVFAFAACGAVGLYFMLASRRNATFTRLSQLRDQGESDGEALLESPAARFAKKVAEPINRVLPASPAEMSKLQKKLMYAGFRSPNAAIIYRAIQFIALVGFPAMSLLNMTVMQFALAGDSTGMMLGTLTKPLPALMLGFFSGYLMPRMILDRLIERRQRLLRWGLADALDLLVVSVEAGLGVNQAMQRVSQELKYAHPDISEEFDLVNTEIRVGRDREEAMRNLAERTGVDDLRGLCAMLIQADRFGTSIARAIRVYSDSLRTRRRQRAEQAAQKAAIKLLFPLAVFLFPTLFIAMLGPAALQLMDHFK